MDPDASTESLMARYQEGDFAAATALVNRLSPQLHRYFLVQFVSRRYADDLLQETPCSRQGHEGRGSDDRSG